MSIPLNLLRYAGVWSVSTRYSQYDFVESPITNLSYVYVGVPDLTGGTDPSVPSANWVQLSPAATPLASFSSTQTQAPLAGTPLPLVYDTADITPVGVSCSLPSSQIVVSADGVYKILASIQCDSTAGLQTLTAYLNYSGTPVDNSATRVVVNLNLESLMTVEWFLEMEAGRSVEVVLYDPVGGGQAVAFPPVVGPPAIPAVPSIITTILRIA